MLDLVKRKLVKTRKVHECYGCTHEIEKGEMAVSVNAREDDRYKNLYLHQHCNQVINSKGFEEEITYGCITEETLKDSSLKCHWCLHDIKDKSSAVVEFGVHGAMYFCSERCKNEEGFSPF